MWGRQGFCILFVMNMKKRLLILLLSGIFLQACGQEAPPHKLLEKGRFALKKTLTFVLNDTINKTQPIQLELNEREAILNFDKGKQRIMGQYNRPERIVYLNNLGDNLAYIRYQEDGFMLYGNDKKMLWQVRILSDKIQISDNSQNNSPHEIRLAENGAYRVFANNKGMGEVTCRQGKLLARGSRIYKTDLKSNHPAFGVLLLNDMQEEWRLIIWTELLRY